MTIHLIVDDGRSSMNDDTINCRLNIALNGAGKVLYDPRPAVLHFLGAKARHQREPDTEIYSNRKFAKQFFQKDGHFFYSL